MPPNAATLTPTAWALVRAVEWEDVVGAAPDIVVDGVFDGDEDVAIELVVGALVATMLVTGDVEVLKVVCTGDVDSDEKAELVAVTSRVVVVTPEIAVAVAGTVSVLCVGDTVLGAAEQTLYIASCSVCEVDEHCSCRQMKASSPRV